MKPHKYMIQRGNTWSIPRRIPKEISHKFSTRDLAIAKSRHTTTVIDTYSRECLANYVRRKLKHDGFLAVFTELFIPRWPSEQIRSVNGSEFTVIALRAWLETVKVQTLFIRSGRSSENG